LKRSFALAEQEQSKPQHIMHSFMICNTLAYNAERSPSIIPASQDFDTHKTQLAHRSCLDLILMEDACSNRVSQHRTFLAIETSPSSPKPSLANQ
jgi:hypothetical protein